MTGFHKLFILVLLYSLAVSPLARAGKDDPTPTDPTPEVFRSESGSQTIKDQNGNRNVVSTDATTLAPSTLDELQDFEETNKLQLAALEETNPEVPVNLFIAENGVVKQVSRSQFLNFASKIKDGAIKIKNRVVSDLTLDPYLPISVALRGSVNYKLTMKGLLLSNGFPHHAAAIGGVTAGSMSALLMLFSGPYSDWLNENSRPDVQFAKGFASSLAYMLIFNGAMALSGYPLQHNLESYLAVSVGVSALGNASQLPVDAVIALKAKELSAEYPAKRKWIATGRSAGFLANSGFVALITALQLQNIPHVEWFYAAAGVPAWIYLGYKNDWVPKLRLKWQLTSAKVSLVSSLVAVQVMNNLNRLVEEIGKSESVIQTPKILTDAIKAKDGELRKANCFIDLSLL